MDADPSKLSYFSLPGEVRNKIMDLVLVHGDVYPHTSVSEPSICSRDIAASFKSYPGIQLIATCKQAYHEGHELFYSLNTFHLLPSMTFEWSDRLQAKHKAMIKRISITVGVDELTTPMISQIEAMVPKENLRKDRSVLYSAVAEILNNAWKSKMTHVAAWTSLEEIELSLADYRYALRHYEVVDSLKESSPWPGSRYWQDVFLWPEDCVFKNIEAKFRAVGWKKTLEWLHTRK